MKSKYIFLALVTVIGMGASALYAGVQVSTATGAKIEYDDQTGIATIDGDAVIITSTAVLKADHIEIFRSEKRGVADGHVNVIRGTQTVTGNHADYFWEASTGVINSATGLSPPWHFSSDRMIQTSKNIFILSDGDLTSCDDIPPHYRLRSNRSRIIAGQRANLGNARLLLGDAPVFWSPLYTRSLIPKKYTLSIEPGITARDGFINKTIIGYPITANSFTKFRWDYLENTGNGLGLNHRYFTPNIKGEFDSYYIRDYNSDPQPQSKRYTVLWNHYQRLSDRLTLNSKIDAKSDQSFGNQFSDVGNNVLVENSERGILSDAGLTYQFSKATLQMDANRQDKFDSSVASNSFVSKITLPKLTLTTIPLQGKYFPFYTSFSGSWTNETLDRTTPEQALRYQRSANADVQIKKDLRFRRLFTFTPRLGFDETWQDRDLTVSTATQDIYVGRVNAGLDLRWRMWRLMDYTLSHNYIERFEQNSTIQDSSANDHGVELNQLLLNIVSRIGRSTRLSLNSGYDFRDVPKNDPTKYEHVSERIVPPSADIQWTVNPKVNIFFREAYALFNPVSRTPVRTPANTSGEFQYGDENSLTFFSQGFGFTKMDPSQESILNLSNRIKLFVSSKWYVDFYLSYRAIGPSGMNYQRFEVSEKTFSVVRNLHCWIFRMSFSERTGNKEATFHIDLKTNLQTDINVFNRMKESDFIPYRPTKENVENVYLNSPK